MKDSHRKWAILAPTALLPKTLRIRTRERWLGTHELGKARRAGLLIIAHPKSGNTWLKAMISRLYQVRLGLPETWLHKSDEYSHSHPEVPRLAATNGIYSYEGAVGRALAVDPVDPDFRSKPTLLLARHPIDIAVSWYFQFTRRQSARKQELINATLERPVDRRQISMEDFVGHAELGVPALIDFLNLWERRLARLEHALIVRYEDLRAEPARELARVTALMGERFSEDEVAEAVRFGSFENLRRLEAGGRFKQGGLTLRDPKDPESFKVRRGKVGGYRDYFSNELTGELEEMLEKRLSPTFGYHASERA